MKVVKVCLIGNSLDDAIKFSDADLWAESNCQGYLGCDELDPAADNIVAEYEFDNKDDALLFRLMWT